MARMFSEDVRHLESLDLLVDSASDDLSAKRALTFGLARIAARASVEKVEFGPARWSAGGWSRRLTVSLVDAEGESSEFTVEVPWLTGIDAALGAPEGIRIGAHAGTFWGRERFPVVSYEYAQGIHYTVRQKSTASRTYRALLVPQMGTSWALELSQQGQRVLAPSAQVIPFLEALAELTDTGELEMYRSLLDLHDLLARWPADVAVSIFDLRDPELAGGPSEDELQDLEARSARQQEYFLVLRAKVIDLGRAPSRDDVRSLLKDARFPPLLTAKPVAVVKLRGRDVTVPDDDVAYHRDLLLAADPEELARLARYTAPSFWPSSERVWEGVTLHGIVATLSRFAAEDADRDVEDALPAHGQSDVGERHPRLTATMDPDNWNAVGYGAQLAGAIADAVSAEARTVALLREDPLPRKAKAGRRPDRPIDVLAARIRKRVQQAVVDVAIGRRAHSNASNVERPNNTLGHVEIARQRSFLGPHGLESYDGRLDLRVQPMSWRGELCPVQTPESNKVGFIRYLALGQWGADDHIDSFRATWGGDLSLAASLVPYIGHDDPTRIAIGAKMFKQAVTLERLEAPLVRTGAERVVGEAGVIRAQNNGKVSLSNVGSGVIIIGRTLHAFGPVDSGRARQDDQWRVLVDDGELVARGTILAKAPDTVIDSRGEPVFAFGLNARVAFMSWDGWNYEDGIVVSESFAERMTSRHTIQLTAEYDFDAGEMPSPLLNADEVHEFQPSGTPVLQIGSYDPLAPSRVLSFPERFRIIPPRGSDDYVQRERQPDGSWIAAVRFEVVRPLQVGDKVTTRHGGKGVITLVVPDADMPRMPDHRPVEVILNSLGVLRRLNIGTLVELHEGLIATQQAKDDGPVPVQATRRLGSAELKHLRARLADLGAPGGRQRLEDASGELVGPREGVLAGHLYLVKLDHLARSKGGARDDGPASPLTFQPVRSSGWRADRKLAAPQRLGEMELWSLHAIGADALVDDLFDHRGVGEPSQRNLPSRRRLLPSGLRAAFAHLAIAGVRVEAVDGAGVARDLTSDPIVGGGDERFRVVRNDGSDLRDLIGEFEAEHGAIRTTSKDVEERVIRWALAQARSLDGDVDPALASQLVQFAIPMPLPIEHPWRSSTMFGPMTLPEVTHLPLLPASLLGTSHAAEWGGLRQRYERILKLTLELREALALDVSDPVAVGLAHRQLSKKVRGFLGWVSDAPADDTVAGRLSGKYGLLRRNTLGAPSVHSGRAVLVGDPTLDPESVRIPRWMADAIGVPEHPTAGFDDVVIVNRQPTLHPYNLIALRAVAWDEYAVAVNPILLEMIAGDFDGDTVAVHRPHNERARAEAWHLRRPSAALRGGAAGSLLVKLDLDVALGLVIEGDAQDGKEVVHMAEEIVGTALEGDRAVSPSDALLTLTALTRRGLTAAKGWSPSVFDESAAGSLAPGIAAGAVKEGDPVLLFERRGTVHLPARELPGGEIEDGYADGLDDEDYFLAAQQGVAGIAAKKLVTPFAGALTRELVRRGYEIVITDDCSLRDAHTPVECTGAGICAIAYGVDRSTGLPVALGARVGIRAALFAGERGTQMALKSIHKRDRNGLLATVQQLSALFGAAGPITVGGEGSTVSTTFVELLRASWAEDRTLDHARAALTTQFVELLEGKVDPVHLEVLLQPVWSVLIQLLEASDELGENFTRDDVRGAFGSVRPTSTVSMAAWRGDLRPIVLTLGGHEVERLREVEHEPVLMSALRNRELAH